VKTIGVVGLGFVGEAVQRGFETSHIVFTYDIVKECTEQSLDNLVKKTEIIFIAVPTPMNVDGACDTRIVESVLTKIANVPVPYRPICVIKSTIPPGTSERLAHQFPNLTIVFNPEFLTEKNYIEDFKNQPYIVLGHTVKQLSLVPLVDVYQRRFPNTQIHLVTSREAELLKYVANTFLATKVTFLNEIYQLCQVTDIDYEKIVSVISTDVRLGPTHWKVPGPDGHMGFGGTCFPKDINALITYGQQNGIELTLLKKVWENNLMVRPEKDWELDKGRAVV
jgi:UDPglucose 6-dehydrogenase